MSVAIPVFNEEATVAELLRRLGAVLDALPGGPHEIVVVSDGSTDGTDAALEAALAQEPRLVFIRLSRNFGHQVAITAGLAHAVGDVVVVMDGDLQDRPEDLPLLIAEWEAGFDVVYAVRRTRQEGLVLRALYAGFYRLVNALSDHELPRDAGDFGLMSRTVVDELNRAPERNRYLRGLRAWLGFRQKGVPVDRDARFAGETKYTPRKLVGLAFDGLVSFSVVPLRAATLVGLGAFSVGALYSAYALFVKLYLDRSPQGFTALLMATMMLGGTQLIFLGIIGEYVGRIYAEVKHRPLFVVDRVERRG